MSQKKQDPDETEIRAPDAEWTKAATTKKLDQVMKFYASDGSLVWPDYPPAKGHAAIRAAWNKMYLDVPDMYLDFEPTHIEVSSGRDMASDFGLVHFAPGAKPDDVGKTAKYLVEWKREHGAWKVFYDCWTGTRRRKIDNSSNKLRCVPRLRSRAATLLRGSLRLSLATALTAAIAVSRHFPQVAINIPQVGLVGDVPRLSARPAGVLT